uniref:Gustatory receptor n=1 Tax=Tetranychus urticae TaxID=32264 RepID=T1JW37_TETUR
MESNETNTDLFAICKPTGILAKGLYFERKVIFLFLGLILYIDGLIWAIAIWNPRNTMGAPTNAIYMITQMTCGTLILLVYWKRNKYIECFNHFERSAQINTLCPTVACYLKKNRFITTIIISLAFAAYFGTNCVDLHTILGNQTRASDVYKRIFIFGIRIIALTGYFACLCFFIETCLYIQSYFLQVETQIQILSISESAITLPEIRKIRRLYCIAIENTEKINSLSMPYIAFYFVLSLVESHFAFIYTIANPTLYVMLICIAELSTFSLVIYHMIYINYLATRIYEQVYSFSFKTESLVVSKEIQMFLTRIALANVGLTFLDIFVITPTCSTSLATISLTIALAAPTLASYIKS